MAPRIFIENPPPFKQQPRGRNGTLVDVPIFEGVETIERYLAAGLRVTGFHHSDLDHIEAAKIHNKGVVERHDSFEYAHLVRERICGAGGILMPHRIVVYRNPAEQGLLFRRLVEHGINNIVLVGRPYSTPPQGREYRTSVEEMLGYLREHIPELAGNLGVIGIPTRRGELERIVSKYTAAGRRLRVVGQFLDEAEPVIRFMESLVLEFGRRGLDLTGLEWNVGLAIFSLRNRGFYARLLRKESLACESRFRDLATIADRITESIRMNLEFADKILESADRLGVDIGFSVQPLIERLPDGRLHPSVLGAAELVSELQSRFK